MRKLPRIPAAAFRAAVRPRPAPVPRTPRSVLVVRTDDIGDLTLTLPLLRSLRVAWPTARVTLLAAPGPGGLVEGSGLADEVVRWTPLSRGRFTAAGQAHAWWFARTHLRPARFDLAVLPRVDYDMTGERYLAAASGAAAVVGFDPRSRRFVPRERHEGVLLTHPVRVGDLTRHQLDHDADLLSALRITDSGGELTSSGRLVLKAVDYARRDELLAELPLSTSPLVVVALGAGHPKRRWPAERYAAVVAAAHVSHRVRVVLTGGPGDRGLADRFRHELGGGVPVVDTVGRADLRTSLALLDRADVYLGGDTGPMHLASSVSTPAVVVSCHPRTGSLVSANAPNRFGPWAPGSVVLQPDGPAPGCHDECLGPGAHCILGVDVAAVEAALVKHLDPLRTEVSR